MEKVLVVSLLVLASLRSASTEEIFIKEGGNVTLDLSPAPSDPITVVQWKFKESILAEWVKDVVDLTHNRENIKLDIVTGRLFMEKITKAEEGVYSVEVNNNVQQVTYNVVVIKDVPKPEIWVLPLACSDEDEQCTLNCEGDPIGAGPVTYSWKTDNGEWKESRRDMPITKQEHEQVETFTCKMKNPVSEKESDPYPNRLYIIKKEEPKPSPVVGIVGGIFGFLLVAFGIGSFWAWKNNKLPCLKRSTNPESTAEYGVTAGAGAKPLLDEKTPGSQDGPPEPHNPPHEEEPVIKEGLAGGEETPNPPHDEKPDIKEGLAGGEETPNPPHDEKPVIKDGPVEGEAGTTL